MIDKQLDVTTFISNNFHPLNQIDTLTVKGNVSCKIIPSIVTPKRTYCNLRICHCDRCAHETILHFYGDCENGINWKNFPQRALTFIFQSVEGSHP